MSYREYELQLEQVNVALESCSDENRQELLSLKHSLEELLALTCDNDSNLVEYNDQNTVDDEYAKFMAEINEVSQSGSNLPKNDSSDTSNLQELEGKKCRAPHVNKWGSKGYDNAMICSVLPSSSNNDDSLVRVLFVNPIHEEMLPCPYYFETDCKFSDEKCKFSHGEIVSASDIQDYVEPDFGTLEIGSPVLAKQSNKLWGRAKITSILENTCMVKFETVKKDMELPFKEILPMEDDKASSLNVSEDDSSGEMRYDQDVVNMSLMNTPSEVPLGDWEKYTNGIGSKLMQKMGYIVGTGLGKKSDGRIDPVTAVVLPPGKSLDHCMNLREKHGGDKNLFSVEKKMKKQQRRQEMQSKKAYQKAQNETDVFKFMNETLNTKQCSSSSFAKSQHRRDIQKETCRNLNVESCKTEANIKKTERDIDSIRQSLTRHKDRNSVMHKNLQQKLKLNLGVLSDLQDKAQNIKNEQDNRRDKKKMSVF